MLADHEITRDELFAVGATFTLVAWGFAYVYTVWQAIEPGSFIAAQHPDAQRSLDGAAVPELHHALEHGPERRRAGPGVRAQPVHDRAGRGRRVHRGRGLPARRPLAPAAGDELLGRAAALQPRGADPRRRTASCRPPATSTTSARRRAAAGAYRGPRSTRTPTSTSGSRRSGGSCGARRRGELQRMADETVALIEAAQADDGYIDTPFQVQGLRRWRNLADEHEIYCMGHLIEAGSRAPAAAAGRPARRGHARARGPGLLRPSGGRAGARRRSTARPASVRISRSPNA